MSTLKSGFGHCQPKWVLHIANRPELDEFQHSNFRTLKTGEAAEVIKQTSNHWRKVFSIMAKISFALFNTECETWQEYRDTKLLTSEGFEALNYQPYSNNTKHDYFSIVAGFTYAETQLNLDNFYPVDGDIKILFKPDETVAVTPYFDWRQLTNEKLDKLITLMKNQLVGKATK